MDPNYSVIKGLICFNNAQIYKEIIVELEL